MLKHGGVREDAYVEDINLAYKLEDGMKIHIPTKQEKENEPKQEGTNEQKTEDYVTTSSGTSGEDKASSSSKTPKDAKVNINTATGTLLETLPGIGPSTANKIMTYRKEKGKFSKIEDIKEVSGIGEAKFNRIKDLICVK